MAKYINDAGAALVAFGKTDGSADLNGSATVQRTNAIALLNNAAAFGATLRGVNDFDAAVTPVVTDYLKAYCATRKVASDNRAATVRGSQLKAFIALGVRVYGGVTGVDILNKMVEENAREIEVTVKGKTRKVRALPGKLRDLVAKASKYLADNVADRPSGADFSDAEFEALRQHLAKKPRKAAAILRAMAEAAKDLGQILRNRPDLVARMNAAQGGAFQCIIEAHKDGLFDESDDASEDDGDFDFGSLADAE